jgi:septal ring factor EnvC (AmiA/AmiB activator)
MINLDQVRTLEWKVKQAVQLIVHLRRENDTLRGRLSDTEVRLQELESLLDAFKATQSEMESGIRSALDELDHLEGTEAISPDQESGVLAAAQVDPLSYPPSAKTSPESVGKASEADAEVSFEEEFAALAAAEAAALADDSPPLDQGPVPASVELEEAEESPPSREENQEPEQPGLGIF